ncbi:MAG: hypothetical protein GXP32_01055 [Kiritimatiellaeota bacterium]|nr:hypothetical protein [Kiritimatiellota bacterium]
MNKMFLMMMVVGVACVSGCTTNNYYARQVNDGCSNERGLISRGTHGIPVEYYSKARYIVSREIIP